MIAIDTDNDNADDDGNEDGSDNGYGAHRNFNNKKINIQNATENNIT